ncbi:glycosyltransferase family 4 protein [Alicyclobacillus fructus]|uniref:glycosyltransferase family 4 protein n=1 Tax=Alicyclobacillus fructus TaxID=2816082 RepID=UPI001A902619|nr:glycosyltransferase family 4 protein [Alicyclobacillus fructus]
MNVLMVGLEWFTLRPGGLPRYVMDFSNAWIRSGHRTKVLVRVPPDAGSLVLPHHVRGVQLASGVLATRSAWKRVFREELTSGAYDVVNSHFAYYAWGLLDEAPDVPLVTHFHGPWAYEARVESQGRMAVRREISFRIQRWIERRVYRHSDQFVVLSKAFRDALHGLYGVPEDRIHIIPGAVDVARFQFQEDTAPAKAGLRIAENRFVILTVRRLARRMGLELLLEAFAQVRASHPEAILVIVGDGALRDELWARVEALKLSNCVRLEGRVEDDLLPMYYQAADLMVVPSVSFEGFGLVTVEAMACGTPVMGTPVGGTEEILRAFRQDLLFRDVSAVAIAEGLSKAISGAIRLPGRSDVREHVLNHYTWPHVVSQVAEVFQMAIGGGAPRAERTVAFGQFM